MDKEEDTMLYTYTLEIVLDVMNYLDLDRGYYQTRSFEFDASDDTDAINVSQSLFGHVLSADGEELCNLNMNQYCIIGILRSTLRDGERYTVTKWTKADFDEQGVKNYGTIERAESIVTSPTSYYSKKDTNEERIERELKVKVWENSLQEIAKIYCSKSRRWKNKIRA
jgi:hypothetical protein